MKFDTRKKKPTLYHALAMTAAVAAALALIQALLPETTAFHVGSALAAAYWAALIVLLLDTLKKQLEYNPYSYNTIYYSGFALFLLSVFVTHCVTMVRFFQEEAYRGSMETLWVLLGSARQYMMLSLPFLAAFSAALVVSNLSLIRHEGRRFVNILGILLAAAILGGEAVIFVFGRSGDSLRGELIMNIYAAVFLYFECMLIGSIAAHLIVLSYVPAQDLDFIIVLGCGIGKDGTPLPLLRGRLDRALDFWREQKAQTGKEAFFVVSGGKGADEIVSEAESMRRYLMAQGVPEDRIIPEDQSTDTFENMRCSKAKICSIDPDAKIAFSTTNYHVFRSGLLARRNKMKAVGMGAKTKWYFWPNAAVREFIGVLTEHRGKQAFVLTGLAAVYAALTLAYFFGGRT